MAIKSFLQAAHAMGPARLRQLPQRRGVVSEGECVYMYEQVCVYVEEVLIR